MTKKYSVISTLFIAQRAVIHIDLPYDEAKKLANDYDSGDVYENWGVEETTSRDRKEYHERQRELAKKSHPNLESFYNESEI